jgi:hypothetical protein
VKLDNKFHISVKGYNQNNISMRKRSMNMQNRITNILTGSQFQGQLKTDTLMAIWIQYLI